MRLLKKLKWALLWAVLIFILCAIPGKELPQVPFLDLLEFDKFVHAGMFFVLLLLGLRGLLLSGTGARRARLIMLVTCVTYGGALELMQWAFIEGRTADVNDFIANSFGAVMGLALYNKIENKTLAKFVN